MRIHNLINSPIFHTYFLFWLSFILFSQLIILRKVCVLEIFLSQSFRRSHYFFKEESFWRNCLMQSFYIQLSLLPFPFPYFFLPSFLFISLTTKQDISFQIQLIKKSVFEDINKKSLNLSRMGCKIHVLHHPIRDVTSSFYLKFSTSYHN